MTLPFFHVDAFTDRPFSGNPAGVCLLRSWPDDTTLRAIAAEVNLSETAFLVPRGRRFHIRWMTPAVEIDLCGHATLAAAHVVMGLWGQDQPVELDSMSGALRVTREHGRLTLDFPARPGERCSAPPALVEGLGLVPREVRASRDYLCVVDSEATVRGLTPDFERLAALDLSGIIVTAPGDDCDFVSRFFAPRDGLNEDPVTGSAHCTLTPYWAKRLGKPSLRARQVSSRGGELWCEDRGERVAIAGHAVTVLTGQLALPG